MSGVRSHRGNLDMSIGIQKRLQWSFYEFVRGQTVEHCAEVNPIMSSPRGVNRTGHQPIRALCLSEHRTFSQGRIVVGAIERGRIG